MQERWVLLQQVYSHIDYDQGGYSIDISAIYELFFFPLVFLGLDVKVSVQNLWNFLCSFVFAFEACSINLLCFLFLVAPVTD